MCMMDLKVRQAKQKFVIFDNNLSLLYIQSYKNRKRMQYAILFLMTMVILQTGSTIINKIAFQFRGVRLSASNVSIRSIAQYKIYLDRYVDNNSAQTAWSQQTVPSIANISITFPTAYTGVSHFLCTSLTINDITIRNYSCVKTGNTVTFRNVLSVDTAIKNVIAVVGNVTNPSPGGVTDTFGGTVGSDVSVPDVNNSVIYLNAGQFASCTTNFDNAYVDKSSSLVVSVSSVQAMNSSVYMLVVFPYFWTRDLARQILYFAPSQFCSSSNNPSILCIGTTDDQGYPAIQVNNTFTQGNFQTSFSLSNILSPPTNQPIKLITIRSYDTTGRPIDECSVYPSGVVQQPLNNIVVTTLQTPYPSTNIGISITFNLTDILGARDTIFLDFSSSYASSYSFTNLTGSFIPTIISSTGTTVNFTFNRQVSQGQILTINTYTLKTAPSLANVSPYLINIQSYGYLKMAGKFTIPVQIAPITNISVMAQRLDVGASSKYTIRFRNGDGVRGNGAVRIYLPNQLTLSSSTSVYCQGIPLHVVLINNTKGIQLSNWSIPSSPQTTLTLQNITNPSTTSPYSGTIYIKVYNTYANMDQVAQGSSTFTITYTSVPSLQASTGSSSNMTAQADIAIYMNVTNRIELPTNSIIKIVYNNIEVGANNNDDACFVNSIVQLCSINVVAKTIVINMTAGSIAGRSAFNVSLQNIFINPYTTKPITTFTVSTYTPDLYLLQYTILPVYLTSVRVARVLSYFILLSRSSTQNNANCDYIFGISQYQPLYADGASTNTLVLVFPSAIDVSNSACDGCTIDASARSITLPISSTFVVLTITNVMNSISTQPIRNITASTMLDNQYLYSYSSQLDNTISNDIPSVLPIASTAYNNRIYGSSTNMSITIPASALQASTRTINITYPTSYNIGACTCGATGLTILSCSIVASVVKIVVSNIQTSPVSISIYNITAPKTATTQPITATTYTTNNYIIAHAQLTPWAASCLLPCQTCTSISTECLSCYNDASIASQSLYDSVYRKCRDACLQTQLQVGLTCVACASTCYSCTTSVSTCTRCATGLYLYNSACAPTCPSLYYKQVVSRVCVPCRSPCQTCTSELQCLTCLSGWYYHNSQCIMSCPLDTTIPNSSTRTCTPCHIECYTCSITTTNCTSCSPDLAMQGGRCVSQCSTGYYIYQGSCVSTCRQRCVTCSIYANRCTTCGSGQHLYNYSCVTVCPSMYYLHSDNTCQYCGNLSIHCKYCASISTCLICDSGYVLLGGQCLDYVPGGYANVTGVAEVCVPPCGNCSNLVRNCTSCVYDYYHNGVCVVECPVSHYADATNHMCIRCVSPCNTCINVSACLSCLSSSYYIAWEYECAGVCPLYYYGNASNYTCMACISPCLQCISYTSCTSCVASTNTYLYNSRCISTCPSLYYANTSTSRCQPCVTPCSTCTTNNGTQCITCISGYYYLYPHECVPVCPPSYIYNYEYSLCTNCTLPCLACSQTQCHKCNSSYILYLYQCVTACPSTHYVLSLPDTTAQCALCSPQCQMCTNSTFCLLCAIGYFWLQTPTTGLCVNQCPPYRPILQPTGCSPCKAQNCTACLPNNKCTQCANVSILFNGFCWSECPTGYIYNQSNLSCSIAPPQQKNQTTPQQNIEQSRSITIALPIPMIFTIAGLALTIAFTLVGCCSRVSVLPLLVCGWALPQTGVLAFCAYAYHLYYVTIFVVSPILGYLMIAAMTILLVLNMVVFWYSMHTIMFKDDRYRRWRKSATCAQLLFLFATYTLTLINFKYQNLLWSQIKCMPKLQSTAKLKYLSIASAIGLLYSIAYTVSFIFLISLANPLLLLWIDGLVVVVVCALCSLLALKRDSHLFEQNVDNVILHRRHVSSDQFITAAMKATYRQQDYGPVPDSKSVAQSSFIDTSSQGSSRLDFRPTSRQFLSSSRSRSQLIQSVQSTPKSNANIYKNKNNINSNNNNNNSNKQISLQCSILSSGNNINSRQYRQYRQSRQSRQSRQGRQDSKYNIECDYESGSKHGNMGSMEQQNKWDGVVHEHELYKQNYDLNDAVLIDADGKKIQAWDIDSNQAVQEEQIQHTNHNQQHQINSNNNTDNILSMIQDHNYNNKQPNLTNQNIKDQTNKKDIPQQVSINVSNSIQLPKVFTRHNQQIKLRENQQISDNKDNIIAQKFSSILKSRLQLIQPNNLVTASQQLINVGQNNKNNSKQFNISKNESMAKSNIPNSKIINKPILSNSILNASIQKTNTNKEKQQQNKNVSYDRFDNSVVSNHQGSMEDDDNKSSQSISQNSQHDGSAEELQQFNQQQQIRQIQQKRRLQQQQRQQLIRIQEMETLKQAEEVRKQYANIDINHEAEGEEERWEFLLQPNSMEHDLTNNQNIEKLTSKDKSILYDKNLLDFDKQQPKYSTQFVQDDQKVNESINNINNKSKVSMRSSRISNKNNKIIKQEQKQEGSKQQNQQNQQQFNQFAQHDEEDINQQECYQQNEQQQNKTVQNQYLASKMKYRQAKPDDHNQFSIKTKKKKKNDPKTKVMVVNSKKFRKLKKQAHQLQRQIEQNQRLKTLIDSKSLGKKPRRSTSKDKQQQLKAIYMKNNTNTTNRYVAGEEKGKKL